MSRSSSVSSAPWVVPATRWPAATISLAITTAAGSGISWCADSSAMDIGPTSRSRTRRCWRSVICDRSVTPAAADTSVSIGSSGAVARVRPRVSMNPRTNSWSMSSSPGPSSPVASFGRPLTTWSDLSGDPRHLATALRRVASRPGPSRRQRDRGRTCGGGRRRAWPSTTLGSTTPILRSLR